MQLPLLGLGIGLLEEFGWYNTRVPTCVLCQQLDCGHSSAVVLGYVTTQLRLEYYSNGREEEGSL